MDHKTTRATGGIHDFDFLFGRWKVAHRRLKQRHAASDDWDEFEGMAETRGLLSGMANVEENIMPGEGKSGLALRSLDLATGLWSIYWVSSADGKLQPPVLGAFEDGIGRFEGDDTDGGIPIRVRFLWKPVSPVAARWEQAFSRDGGGHWETNWTMDFTRIED